jgi:YfiH family protein
MSEITFLTAKNLSARHGFFTRKGGVSVGPYASLQNGFGAKGDTRQNAIENRRRALAALDLSHCALISGNQVHSASAIAVQSPIAQENAPKQEDAPKVDGFATSADNIALGVLTADCAPVLFEDAEAGVVGACHAGWRGARDGVVAATIKKMESLGAQRTRIAAAIGPCIGPEAYEVGPEFVDTFGEKNARFFTAAAPGRPEDRRRFDLPRYIVDIWLQDLCVENLNCCTYADPDRFFSNRRAHHHREPDYGRLITIIAPLWR